MNISQLKYICEVEKAGSITQAAQNLFMSQPNLSKALRDMEAALGFAVFARTSKGVQPTEKGRELLDYAKNVLKAMSLLESRFESGMPQTRPLRLSR